MNVAYHTLLFVTALVIAGSANADCGGAKAKLDAQKAADLVVAIEAKFDITASEVSYKCGGGSISFGYKPPVQIVPTNSFFRKFNDFMVLGEIPADRANTIPLLVKFLNRDVAEIERLKLANANFHKDSMQLQQKAMVHVYDPSAYAIEDRVTEAGQLLYIVMAHCYANGGMNSADELGTVQVPVFSIEGILASKGAAALYKSGDAVNGIRAKREVSTRFVTYVADNKAALENGMGSGKYCASPIGDRETLVDWNQAMKLLVP